VSNISHSICSQDLETVAVDADLMSQWLEDVPKTMSSKLLYDLKTLLSHYAGFLVSNKKVTVEFPVEGIPCADVGESTIYIPVNTLAEGRVDHTISSVVHELHHIEHSLEMSKAVKIMEPILRRILGTIRVDMGGHPCSLLQKLEQREPIYFWEPKDSVSKHGHEYHDFLLQVAQDVCFLYNVLEDVRIDEMQSPSLSRYRLKHEKYCYEKSKEREDTPGIYYSKLFEALFHYKDLEHSDDIASRRDNKKAICEASAEQIPAMALHNFIEEVRDQICRRWEELVQESEESLVQQFLESKAADTFDQEDETESAYGLRVKSSKEVALDAPQACKAEEEMLDMMDEGWVEGEPGQDSDTISASLNAEIESFRNLTIVPCTEILESNPHGVTYDSLIIDYV
jgi:hypothetical protein